MMTMRVCAVLYALMLLLSRTLSKTHVAYPQRSMEINPDIYASWYTGRGIRPVGRFGRRTNGRIQRLVLATHSLCSQHGKRRLANGLITS
ncbi:prolactin-releasing peptide [Salvelinus alpinus]